MILYIKSFGIVIKPKTGSFIIFRFCDILPDVFDYFLEIIIPFFIALLVCIISPINKADKTKNAAILK